MTVARIAYLTTPGPDRFILNFQFADTLGNDVLQSFEISKAHLANIIIDGTSLALREAFVHHRVPFLDSTLALTGVESAAAPDLTDPTDAAAGRFET